MKKLKIKTGDKVIITAGEDKGKKGEVLQVLKHKDRVVVEGVNVVHKHEKPSANNPQGGIKEVEASIHISNVSHFDQDDNPIRVGYRENKDGKKERYSKKSGEVI